MSQEIIEQMERAIAQELPEATIRVTGAQGHYSVEVVAAAFEGQSRLQRHRMVYGAIEPLMRGAEAPVHAIDTLRTETP